MAGGRFGTCRLDLLRTRMAAGGWTIEKLARAVVVGDATIVGLLAGGNVENEIASRISAVMGDSLATLGQALL